MAYFRNTATSIGADMVRFRWPLVLATVLALLARAQSMTMPMYCVDCWEPIGPATYPQMLADGRWGFVLGTWLLKRLGYDGMDVVASALFLSTILLIGAAFAYGRILFNRPGAFELFVFISLFVLHPFNTEFFTFSITMLSQTAAAIFLAAAGLACANAATRWTGLAAGVLLLVLSASVYQTGFTDAVVISLLSLVGQIPASDPMPAELRKLRHNASVPQVRAFLTLIGSAIAYFVSNFALLKVLGLTASERFSHGFNVGEMTKRLEILISSVGLALEPPSGIVPSLTSAVLFGVIVVSAAAIVRGLLRQGAVHTVLGVLILLVSGILAVSLNAISIDYVWFTPRIFSPYSIWVAGVVALGWREMRLAPIRYGTGCALALILLSFVGSSNRILYDQWRLNLWDRQQANRILTRLENDTHFAEIHALALVKGNWRYPLELPTEAGDMNYSAFADEWSKAPMFGQATGFSFGVPTDAEAEAAKKYCAAAGAWPSADAAVIRDGVAIVCLTK